MSGGQPPQYGKDVEAGVPLTDQQNVTVYPTVSNHPDYLVFSILNCLFCCCCIGIAAIVKSVAVRDANSAGDSGRASSASREALTLNKVALGIGIAINLIWIVIVIVCVALLGMTFGIFG